MRWIVLDLGHVEEISAQVDTVINTYTTLQRQLEQRRASNPAQVERALGVLRRSFSDRLEEMLGFYEDNDLDPRSSVLEAARLKLKRFLRSVEPRDVSDLSYNAHTISSTPITESVMQGVRTSDRSRFQPMISTYQEQEKQHQQHWSLHATPTGHVEGRGEKEMVTVRLVLTEAEYHEILARHEAFRQLKMDGVFVQ